MMEVPDWLIAYSNWPGRYYVVQLNQPRWFYVFDHVQTESGCELQSQAFQSIAPDVPSEQIYTDQLVEQAYDVFKQVAKWFEPLPLCESSDYESPPPRWFFGTSPETSDDDRILLALRAGELANDFAVLSFDEEGFFVDIEPADSDFAIEAHEAFQLWTGFGDEDPTRQRFLP